MSADAAFVRALDAALRAPAGAALGSILHAPTVTAIVTDPRDEPRLALALPRLLAALERAGVPRGRCTVLLAAPDGTPPARALAGRLRAALALPVIAHDPEHSACFVAGHTPEGAGIEIHDELREAEAVVVAASYRDAGDPARALLVDGLAPRSSRGRGQAVPDGIVPELLLLWCEEGGVRAWCGRPEDFGGALGAGWTSGDES